MSSKLSFFVFPFLSSSYVCLEKKCGFVVLPHVMVTYKYVTGKHVYVNLTSVGIYCRLSGLSQTTGPQITGLMLETLSLRTLT